MVSLCAPIHDSTRLAYAPLCLSNPHRLDFGVHKKETARTQPYGISDGGWGGVGCSGAQIYNGYFKVLQNHFQWTQRTAYVYAFARLFAPVFLSLSAAGTS